MPTSVNPAGGSHVISETESRRVYRFNNSLLTDVMSNGTWLTVSVKPLRTFLTEVVRTGSVEAVSHKPRRAILA